TQGVHDPLEINLTWLEDGQQPYLLASLDILLFEKEFSQRVSSTLSQEMDLPGENIIISAIHTHSAPAIHDFLNVGWRDPQWEKEVEEKIYLAALQARKKARRAQAAWRQTTISLGFNRRQANGAVDPTFLLAFFVDARDEPLVLWANYGCHPVVLTETNLFVSADYVGAFREKIRQYFRAKIPVLFFTGAAGDVDPRERGTFALADKMGGRLQGVAVSLLKEMDFSSEVEIVTTRKRINLPLAPPPPLPEMVELHRSYQHQAREATRQGDVFGEAIAKAFALWAEELITRIKAGTLPQEREIGVALWRWRDNLLLAHSLELFAATAVKLRQQVSPTLWFLGYSHGYGGYLPDEEAFRQGGYEVEEAYKYLTLLPYTSTAEELFRREVLTLINHIT
ncbi:hypothetical protein NLC35_03730, partial [Candidatus Aminicenantes bacterium AC-334-K16]|nr:hypothetical protein [Candidatus Aminicenantes bacterium AC-334-K16]